MENHTLKFARFMNNSRTTIVAEWTDNENPGTIRETYISANETDVQYEKLLKLIDLDSIHENTVNFYKKANKDILAYMNRVHKISSSPLLNPNNVIELGEDISVQSMSDIFKFLPNIFFNQFDSEKYSESLFTFKLSVFELDFMKKSTNRKVKSEIRKAKTPIEILNGVMKVYNEIQHGSNNSKGNKKISA
tara:strand:- start:486 stop:1058 length:573 start_codon:yes stop_codon:yes gene_type:complete